MIEIGKLNKYSLFLVLDTQRLERGANPPLPPCPAISNGWVSSLTYNFSADIALIPLLYSLLHRPFVVSLLLFERALLQLVRGSSGRFRFPLREPGESGRAEVTEPLPSPFTGCAEAGGCPSVFWSEGGRRSTPRPSASSCSTGGDGSRLRNAGGGGVTAVGVVGVGASRVGPE